MDRHRTAELRSLAYHRAIAARLTDDPTIVTRAGARLDRAVRAGTSHPHYVAIWRALLALPVAELVRALGDDSEAMTAARQATPFTGVLTARERWALWRSVAATP